MPAIDLAQLKTQAARLAEKFTDPSTFLHALNGMLDAYTNQTMRQSRFVRRLSLPEHHTPNPVLRQIEREMAPMAEAYPVDAVKLVEALWEDSYLETRILAGRLLGMIPLQQAVPAFLRLPDWLAKSPDKQVRTVLLTDSLARLRRESPETFFNLLESWLTSPRSGLQVWGLQAIIPLLEESGFDNLPSATRILRPAIEKAGPSTQFDLLACIKALARVSSTETIVFLRDILMTDPEPMLVRTLRRILPALPDELQVGLQACFRNRP